MIVLGKQNEKCPCINFFLFVFSGKTLFRFWLYEKLKGITYTERESEDHIVQRKGGGCLWYLTALTFN